MTEPSTGSGRTSSTAQAVLRALSLLRGSGCGLTPSELADAIGKSRWTAAALLNSLVSEGYAVRDEKTARYHAVDGAADGVVTSAPAVPARTWGDLWAKAGLLADELVTRTGHGAVLAIDDGALIRMVYAGRNHPGALDLEPTMHAVAHGKALLAAHPWEPVERWFADRPLRRYTERTTTDLRRLEQELDVIARRGYAVEEGEYAANLASIAVPVPLNPLGRHPVFSLGLVVPPTVLHAYAKPLLDTLRAVAAPAM